MYIGKYSKLVHDMYEKNLGAEKKVVSGEKPPLSFHREDYDVAETMLDDKNLRSYHKDFDKWEKRNKG